MCQTGICQESPGGDLPTALDSALTLVRERAMRRGIALEKSVDPRLGLVRADDHVLDVPGLERATFATDLRCETQA